MTQTELEGQGPEGQLNTQSEKDPKSVVTFVYREGNPFMDRLASNSAQRGLNVQVKALSYKEVKSFAGLSPYGGKEENAPKRMALQKLLGELAGVIVTDGTVHQPVETLFENNTLSAYDALYARYDRMEGIENLWQMVEPVIEELRETGIEPVVFDSGMADHLQFKFGDSEEDKRWQVKAKEHGGFSTRESFYTWFLKEKFGLQQAHSLEVKPGERKVFLVDHHLYNGYMGKKREPTGPEIVPICPCCIGLKEKGYLEYLQNAGFRLYPLKYERVFTQTENRLAEMIAEKRASILRGKEFEESIVRLGELEPGLTIQTTKYGKPEIIIPPSRDEAEPENAKNKYNDDTAVAVNGNKLSILMIRPRFHEEPGKGGKKLELERP